MPTFQASNTKGGEEPEEVIGFMERDLGLELEEADRILDAAPPITEKKARELINVRSSTIKLQVVVSLLIVVSSIFVLASFFFTEMPSSAGDYFVLLGLMAYLGASLILLVVVYAKTVSFDGQGVDLEPTFGKKRHYDWSEVTSLNNVPWVPGLAALRLSDGTKWPIFMELDNAQSLREALSVWASIGVPEN